MVNRWKRFVAAASILGLTLSLAACNRNYEILGPYSLGYDGQHLLVGICTNLQVHHVRLSATPPGSQARGDTVSVWEASGDAQAREGDRLIVGGTNPGLRNEVVLDDAYPEPGVLFVLGFNDLSDAALSAVFEIPDDGLAPGSWLTPLDEIRETPCEALERTG
ncbi:hypothetical protein GCM10025870_32760 [Agromyces marinus]|uniref:Uncharacterized protein n=1 Tax=Agromyces marinus TaxID=1389020 RepID=A0ABN6YG49_9MICO|nr:hypothetical protein GCM10025870_32760 [Agromyces marinus]